MFVYVKVCMCVCKGCLYKSVSVCVFVCVCEGLYVCLCM